MRRADRLLQIVQAMRRHRGPVTAQALAEQLEVSRRTIYRDILDLQSSLVPIEGEAGIGYVLRPGYDLPPLMFTVEEVETIVLGARLVRSRGDRGLTRAADDILAKIAAVLPARQAEAMERTALHVPPRSVAPNASGPHLELLRIAIRERQKLAIAYSDLDERLSRRTVWPLALLFFADATLLGAWCELRSDFRFFRSDRIFEPVRTETRFDTRNGALLDGLTISECAPRAQIGTAQLDQGPSTAPKRLR